MSNVHVCDNANLDKNDIYAKVRPLFDALNTKFLEFAPHEEHYGPLLTFCTQFYIV